MATQRADRCQSRRTVSARLAVCRRRLACSALSRPFNTATDWLFKVNDRGWHSEYGPQSTSERVRRRLLRALRGSVSRDYGAEGIDRQQGPQRSGPSPRIRPIEPAVSGRAQGRRAEEQTESSQTPVHLASNYQAAPLVERTGGCNSLRPSNCRTAAICVSAVTSRETPGYSSNDIGNQGASVLYCQLRPRANAGRRIRAAGP